MDEPLSAKVSFGIQSATPAVTAADTQADSLQKAVDAGNVRLSYDTAWGTNAAAVTRFRRFPQEDGSPSQAADQNGRQLRTVAMSRRPQII